ncbi:MAG: hypothetical protein ACREPD_06140 [Stenotrophomonas sp.]|uniref:hypothetical protein n=1 Tax=Stenotrophomonas sp. TaxID=69392 RepID=UPI003D6C7887
MTNGLNLLAATVVAFALAGCASQAKSDLVASAEKAVRHVATDPGSVQFREVRVVQLESAAGKAPIVCGEFNAKNRLGGYTGFEPFAWHPDGKLLARSLFPREGQSIADAGIASLCAGVLPQI